jgi:hypothetical protein
MNVMMQDIEKMRAVSGFWKIYQQDARRLETLQEHCHELSQGCQAVITSPPYPNRHDYSRVFQIELLTLGLQESDIFALRHNSLRSHVEARRPQDSLPVFILPRQLEIALEALLDKKIERRLQSMIIGYFEDMYAVLRSAYQILSFGGHMALVVGNVRH